MRYIAIDGWWGSGKGLVSYTLDNIPNSYSDHYQLNVFSGLAQADFTAEPSWLRERETFALRSTLCGSGYYRLESFSHTGHFPYFFSKENCHEEPFNFSFYDFDRALFEQLDQGAEWSFGSIIDRFYSTLMRFQKEPTALQNIDTVISLEGNSESIFSAFKYKEIDLSMVYMMRSPEGILASIGGRQSVKGTRHTSSVKSTTDRKHVYKILDRQKLVTEMAKRHPGKILILHFEEVINAPEQLRQQLADFLKIDAANPTLEPSLYGKPLQTTYGIQLFNKVMDTPEHLGDQMLAQVREWIDEYHQPPVSLPPVPSKNILQRGLNAIGHRLTKI